MDNKNNTILILLLIIGAYYIFKSRSNKDCNLKQWLIVSNESKGINHCKLDGLTNVAWAKDATDNPPSELKYSTMIKKNPALVGVVTFDIPNGKKRVGLSACSYSNDGSVPTASQCSCGDKENGVIVYPMSHANHIPLVNSGPVTHVKSKQIN